MRRYSLYTLFFGSLIILTGILFLLVYLTTSYQRNELIKTAIDEKLRLAETVNEMISSPIWKNRIAVFPGVEKIFIIEMAKSKDIVFLRRVRLGGSIYQSNIEEEWGKVIEDPDIANVLLTKKAVIKDDVYNGEKIKLIVYPGFEDETIWVGFSLKSIEESVRQMVFRSSLVGFAGLFFVSLLLFLILRIIIDPIKRLTASCEEIRKGNLDVKVDVKSKTEIGELATTFNEMIKDLRESHTALEEAKTVLEIKVEARTKELRELAEGLEAEVERRTKEVRERMEELERFHRLAVGRELKMIELKKEIEKLKKELEKTKPST